MERRIKVQVSCSLYTVIGIRSPLIVDDRPSIVDDQKSDLNVEVFVNGRWALFSYWTVDFSCLQLQSIWSNGYLVVGLSASSIPNASSKWCKKMYQPS